MGLILTINPGSTSTKIALFEGTTGVFSKTLRHSLEEISGFNSIIDQYKFRRDVIVATLLDNGIKLSDIVIIVGRGGLLKPIESGVYQVNDVMLNDLASAKYGEHASNLGALIANSIAHQIGCRAFIADPVVVDELSDVARVSGHPLFPRASIFHALNQKAIAKQYASDVGKKYEELRLVVVHLGGGVSVGVHLGGRVVDVNNALKGDGPFSPERSGTITAFSLAELCFSGKYEYKDVKKMLIGEGGVVAHLGTNSFLELEQRVAAGDEKATLIADAFIYNVAKQIGASAVVLFGKVDAILITGGIAYGKEMMKQLTGMVEFIAPVKIYPGEDEMGALARNGLAVLEGREEIKEYK